MKRIAIITATVGLLFAAVPAVATPTSSLVKVNPSRGGAHATTRRTPATFGTTTVMIEEASMDSGRRASRSPPR